MDVAQSCVRPLSHWKLISKLISFEINFEIYVNLFIRTKISGVNRFRNSFHIVDKAVFQLGMMLVSFGVCLCKSCKFCGKKICYSN